MRKLLEDADNILLLWLQIYVPMITGLFAYTL